MANENNIQKVQTVTPHEARIAELERENAKLTDELGKLRKQLSTRNELTAKERAARAGIPYAKVKIRAGDLGVFEPGDPIPAEVAAQLHEGEQFVLGVVPGTQ